MPGWAWMAGLAVACVLLTQRLLPKLAVPT